jgi:hypothetical protein
MRRSNRIIFTARVPIMKPTTNDRILIIGSDNLRYVVLSRLFSFI